MGSSRPEKALEDSVPAHVLISENTICAAVGKDVEEGKSILLWAFHNSGGRKICILHVHHPPNLIRHPLGPAKTPAEYVNEALVRESQDKERVNMQEILHKYDHFCGKMGVRAERLQTETESTIEEGIVKLITQHGVRRLVMGAAAKRHYNRKPRTDTENGESSLMMLRSRSVPSGNNMNVAQTGISNMFRSQSVAQNHIREYRNIVKSVFNAMFQRGTKEPSISPKSRSEVEHNSTTSDHESDVLSLRSPSGSSPSTYSPKGVLDLTLGPLVLKPSTPMWEGFEFMSTPFSPGSSPVVDVASSNEARSVADKSLDNPHYEKLQQVMVYAEKLTLLQQKVARELGEAMSKAQEELILRREIEEGKAKEREIETMKNQIDQLMEKFQIFQERETSLKNQIVELQVERDNAVKEAEELRHKQGECSSWNNAQYFAEFSLSEIKKATQNFHESLKIGGGGYGNIYKGYLHQIEVAIKRLHSQNLHSNRGQGPSEFQMEVRVLSRLSHPNLVRLIGSCPEEFALIYEYLPNGSLEDRLKCRDKSPPLLWKTRICIAAELCSVLVYLHSSKPHSIVHGDLKPSNILLDASFVSKLSDFGICRVLCHNQCSNNNTTLCRITVPKGTLGYVDPEFLETGKLTMKSDVYSFGIILLQLLTNRSAISIANEVKYALGTVSLQAVLDPSAGDWPIVVAQSLAELALSCCDRNQKNRPELGSDVLGKLESMRASS
ncbi:U-box domain-containing protein 33-like isoform X2 [Juglans regia]|uniref:RING-type E3 ubiquitin transferase n=1 Tax=Juglans regia TaxID=51240 RepID=A0A6P9EKB7_JUGRE|nr:U-box domain-containing protein 33-like isoform X2 [Juglans regia]